MHHDFNRQTITDEGNTGSSKTDEDFSASPAQLQMFTPELIKNKDQKDSPQFVQPFEPENEATRQIK